MSLTVLKIRFRLTDCFGSVLSVCLLSVAALSDVLFSPEDQPKR